MWWLLIVFYAFQLPLSTEKKIILSQKWIVPVLSVLLVNFWDIYLWMNRISISKLCFTVPLLVWMIHMPHSNSFSCRGAYEKMTGFLWFAHCKWKILKDIVWHRSINYLPLKWNVNMKGILSGNGCVTTFLKWSKYWGSVRSREKKKIIWFKKNLLFKVISM